MPAVEIVLHRSAWSLLFMLGLLALLRRFAWLGPVLRRPRTLAVFGLSAMLLAGNWLLYVWAVNVGAGANVPGIGRSENAVGLIAGAR